MLRIAAFASSGVASMPSSCPQQQPAALRRRRSEPHVSEPRPATRRLAGARRAAACRRQRRVVNGAGLLRHHRPASRNGRTSQRGHRQPSGVSAVVEVNPCAGSDHQQTEMARLCPSDSRRSALRSRRERADRPSSNSSTIFASGPAAMLQDSLFRRFEERMLPSLGRRSEPVSARVGTPVGRRRTTIRHALRTKARSSWSSQCRSRRWE